MAPLDHQAISDAQGAQEFQSFTMAATADVIAKILSKVAERDVTIDDLIIYSGRNKVWHGSDESFPRDNTFNDQASRLKDALMDPESNKSFRVFLQYPDGHREMVFQQTGGKVVEDMYGLAKELRAAYAMDAVEQFTPDTGEQDFVLSYADAQEMAAAKGIELPEQPAGGQEMVVDGLQNTEPQSSTEIQSEILPDPWTDAETQLNDRPPVETQIEQVPEAVVTPVEQSSQPADISQITYSQQRNLAALSDVNGQIAELDRRAAEGMTYIADPDQNPGYKALLERAEDLREALGDLAVLAEVSSEPIAQTQEAIAEVVPVPEIQTASEAMVKALDREVGNNPVEQEAAIDVQAATVSETTEEKLTRQLADVENVLAETYNQYDEKAAELGSDRVDVQIISLETRMQSLRDRLDELQPKSMQTEGQIIYQELLDSHPEAQGVEPVVFEDRMLMLPEGQKAEDRMVMDMAIARELPFEDFTQILAQGSAYVNANLDVREGNGPQISEGLKYLAQADSQYRERYFTEVIGLEPAAVSTAMVVSEVPALAQTPVYDDVFIEDIFVDYQLEAQVQKTLAAVAETRGQLEVLRTEMNGQLQGTAQLTDAIAQNVKDPAMERWADKIGGVAEGQAANWKEQLRNAVAVTVEFAQQIYESPAGQYVVEQAIAGTDAVGQMIVDKTQKDIETTKAFIADKFSNILPEAAKIDSGIELLIEHKGSVEDDRGVAHHEGYTFLKDGDRHGIMRDSDEKLIYTYGNFTRQTTEEEKAFIGKFASVAEAAKPLIEAAQQSSSRQISGGAEAD